MIMGHILLRLHCMIVFFFRCVRGGTVFWHLQGCWATGVDGTERGTGTEWTLHKKGVPEDALHYIILGHSTLSGEGWEGRGREKYLKVKFPIWHRVSTLRESTCRTLTFATSTSSVPTFATAISLTVTSPTASLSEQTCTTPISMWAVH